MTAAEARERHIEEGRRAVREAVRDGRLPADVPRDTAERVAAVWCDARRVRAEK